MADRSGARAMLGGVSRDAARGIISTGVVVAAAAAIIGFVYVYLHSIHAREYDLGRLLVRASLIMGFLIIIGALLLHAGA